MNYNTILSFFGLEPNDFKPIVSDLYGSNGTITMICEQRTDINRICPFCLSKKIVIKDYDDIILRSTINSNQKCELLIKKDDELEKFFLNLSERLINTQNEEFAKVGGNI